MPIIPPNSFDPSMAGMTPPDLGGMPAPIGPPADPSAASRDPLISGMLAQVQKDIGSGGAAQPLGGDKLYQYALLSALLGSAGAGIGQSFRPWVRPPQPLPSPQAPQMPITAPSALQALTQTRAARKGY